MTDETFTLTAEQADLAVEALRKCFLFDGWHFVPAEDAALLSDTLTALGECDVEDEYRLGCETCGRVGSTDDGIELGGECQYPCPGTVKAVQS